MPQDAIVSGVVASGSVSMAITEDGGLYSWGDNKKVLLGYPSENFVSRPKQISSFVNMKTRISQVSIGTNNVVAVSTNGNVYQWGSITSENLNQKRFVVKPTLLEKLASSEVEISLACR